MAKTRHLELFTLISSNAPCCDLSRVPFFRILGRLNSEILPQFPVCSDQIVAHRFYLEDCPAPKIIARSSSALVALYKGCQPIYQPAS